MNCFADATGVRGGGCGQGQRGEVPRERYEQQESGDEALHVCRESRTPWRGQNRAEGGMGASRRARAPAPHTTLGFALDFRPPPADTYEEETPVAEEFGGLAFEGVPDELEKPSEEKKS